MSAPLPQEGFDWSELPAEDIVLRLRQLQAQGSHAQTGFLDTHQWCRLVDVPGVTLDGGYRQAQFRRAGLDESQPSVTCWTLPLARLPQGVRTARQLRSWLARHDVLAGHIGDILLGDYVWLATQPGALASLPVAFEDAASGTSVPTSPELRVTAASARLDAVAGAIFHVSRGEAQTAIEYDFVFLNFHPAAKPAQQVRAGDQLVYRTKGRAELLQMEANVRSGRLWITYRIYDC